MLRVHHVLFELLLISDQNQDFESEFTLLQFLLGALRRFTSVAGYATPPSRFSAISYVIIQPELRLYSDAGQFLNLSKVVLTRCPNFLTKV